LRHPAVGVGDVHAPDGAAWGRPEHAQHTIGAYAKVSLAERAPLVERERWRCDFAVIDEREVVAETLVFSEAHAHLVDLRRAPANANR
jgi:hypothetical protein